MLKMVIILLLHVFSHGMGKSGIELKALIYKMHIAHTAQIYTKRPANVDIRRGVFNLVHKRLRPEFRVSGVFKHRMP